MNISKRITLYSTVWLFILLLIVNSGVYLLFGHLTVRAELARVSTQTEVIAEAVRPDRGNTRPADLLAAYVPGNGMIRVIREDGKEAITITKDPALRMIPRIYSTAQETEKMTFQGNQLAVARFPLIWSDGTIVTLEYSEQMDTMKATLSILKVVLVVASLLVLLPAFLAGRELSRMILRPIYALMQTMERIRQSGTFQRIEVSEQSKDELDQMGLTFNRMIDLLETNYERQQQFVSDASHELRTPLTVIESYARLLNRWGMSDPGRLKEGVEAILEESMRMKELTQQMLTLATGEPDRSLALTKLDLTEIASNIARKLERTYDREIMINATESCEILGDQSRIKQLLFILLENGLKYSDRELLITLSHVDKFVQLEVVDQGIGIPQKDLPHVFERFFRVDKARSRMTGGSGLGLAIAKTIVDGHGGQISIKSKEQVGSTFNVLFPRI
ncbi:HAMP domain-containing protein [bacterium LRH843]|nr:HAMP domain-containing protein [bacterium LRH843]